MVFGAGVPKFDGQSCFGRDEIKPHVDKHVENRTAGLRRILVIYTNLEYEILTLGVQGDIFFSNIHVRQGLRRCCTADRVVYTMIPSSGGTQLESAISMIP